MYDLARRSMEILPKLRFIYLLSLLEAFVKEYVSVRDRISEEDVHASLHTDSAKSWQQLKKGGVLESTSLLNLAFVRHAFEMRFRLEFSLVTYECFWEAGPLRNCLVHKGGILTSDEFCNALRLTAAFLDVPPVKGEKLLFTDRLLWQFIEGARQFIQACKLDAQPGASAAGR